MIRVANLETKTMKLFHAAASPFVRKVMVVVHETGLDGRIELIAGATTPVDANPDLARSNPVGKIPALVLGDGTTLAGSALICEYLDSQHDGVRMIPASGVVRWQVLGLQAICDGMLDAAVLNRYETMMRPEDLRWDAWSAGQMGKVDRVMDSLEMAAADFGDRVDLGTISAGCACGYLDFRYADRDWRGSRPALAAWYADFSGRPSMQATKPST